jgi:tetratricopeptide (TPR) repeat protein
MMIFSEKWNFFKIMIVECVMKQFLLIFAVFAFLEPAFSNIPDSQIKLGLDMIYNLKFADAENHFNALEQSNPGDIRPQFYLSQIYFYKALPSRNESDYLKFLELSDRTIETGELLLDKNEKDYDAMYFLGLAHSYRSLLMLNLNKNLIGAAFSGKTGYGILEDLVKEKPDYYDAYMGLGLYKIAIGFVPGKYQWLLSVIGFNGNLKEGKQHLQTAYEKGKFTSVEARVYLAFFSIKEREESSFEAMKIMEGLVNEYPSSPVFKLFLASLYQQMNMMDESIKLTNAALEQNTNSLQNEMKKGAYSLLGTAYFRKNDFPNAVKYFEEHLRYIHPEDRYNVSYFLLGISYEMTGNKQEALLNYSKTRDKFVNERDGEGEKFFLRLAEQRKGKGLNKFDSLLIITLNKRECGMLDSAIGEYTILLDENYTGHKLSGDDRLKIYFELGNSYFLKKDYANAEKHYQLCIDTPEKNESWIKPHAMFELGKIYGKLGYNERAEDTFEQMKDINDFDFEVFLDMRYINYRNN